MIVLAIEGALGAFSAAVARDGAIVSQASERGNVALEAGLGLVDRVLREAEVTPKTLDRLAVGRGPGGFTGLRIALAYAKSLAQAWERPLVGISSFDLLEQGRTFARVLTVVVGRPGVISARFRQGERIVRHSGWTADVLDAVLPTASPEMLWVVGAPKDVLAALAERRVVVRPVDPCVTPAAAAAALAAPLLVPGALHHIDADYGELPAAKVPKRA